MNAQAEDTSKVFDVIKQGLSLIFIVAGVSAFYYFADVAGFTLLYRVLALVAIILIALGVMLTTATGRNVWAFALEAKQEVRKVVWPTRQETVQTTLMVIVAVIILGILLWLIDMVLVSAVQYLTGRGS